jgi:hypothetical protein
VQSSIQRAFDSVGHPSGRCSYRPNSYKNFQPLSIVSRTVVSNVLRSSGPELAIDVLEIP